MLSSDDAPPVDRPNLSKDYLAGSAPEEWLPLRDAELLFRQRHRPSPQYDRRRDRRPRARSHAPERRQASLRSPASRDRRRARVPFPPWRQAVGRARASLAQRLPGDHRTSEDGAPGGRPRARASSASKSRPRCARATSRSMSSRRKSGRWRKFWARTLAASCKRFTRNMASSSIWARRASGMDGKRVTLSERKRP